MKPRCAPQQNWAAYVRFGSGADITRHLANVRFTPLSGQIADIAECPLCAKSGLMHRSKNSFHWITYRRAGRKAREPGSDTSSPGHAEGEPGLANISGTELTDGGEAGDFKGLRDPPLAPCFRTGAFLLAPRHRTYPRVGGPDPPPVIDDSALARGFSLRCSKMFSPLASHMSIR